MWHISSGTEDRATDEDAEIATATPPPRSSGITPSPSVLPPVGTVHKGNPSQATEEAEQGRSQLPLGNTRRGEKRKSWPSWWWARSGRDSTVRSWSLEGWRPKRWGNWKERGESLTRHKLALKRQRCFELCVLVCIIIPFLLHKLAHLALTLLHSQYVCSNLVFLWLWSICTCKRLTSSAWNQSTSVWLVLHEIKVPVIQNSAPCLPGWRMGYNIITSQIHKEQASETLVQVYYIMLRYVKSILMPVVNQRQLLKGILWTYM